MSPNTDIQQKEQVPKPTTKEEAEPKRPKEAVILQEVMANFNSARSYTRKGFWTTWKNARKLYNNERVQANYIGNSDTFIPETFTILQSIRANIIGGKISMNFLPTRDDQIGDAQVLNALMDQIWEKDRTKLKASWALEDSLVVGNGYLWQYVDDGLPSNLYVPTEDNFFDPNATNYENLQFGGYRHVTTLKELKDEMVPSMDEEPGEPYEPKYKNLDKIKPLSEEVGGNTIHDDKTAKQLREEMIAGSPLAEQTFEENRQNTTPQLVEVICYFDKKRMIKIANRSVIIMDEETPFQREETTVESVDDLGNPVSVVLPEIESFIPVAPARDYVDGAMWYAKGEVEVIGELQELLNDTQNQKTDNLNYTLNRMWTLDPSQAHKKDEIQSVPGAVFTIPPGSLEQIQTASIGGDADNEMLKITSAMRRATAADELIQGAGQDQGDVTATEVRATLAQAGTRFGSKLEIYENEFFSILGKNMFKILQIFTTQEVAVRMLGPKGVEWKNYNPGEFLGDYDIKVKLDGSARIIKETEKQEAMQFFLMASKMPFVDQQTLFKVVAGKLFDKTESELKDLIQQAPPMMPGMEEGMAPPMGAPGEMPQQGQGEMAQMPMSDAEQGATNTAMQGQGMNVPGMPQA